MLFHISEANPGKFIPPYRIEQVSSVELYQYAYEGGEAVHSCIGTDFTGQWVGGNVPVKVFSETELQSLNKRLVENFGCMHFVLQYHQAKNNISAGLYVESFLLFCSCVESMLYYWCENIAALCGKQSEYIMFSNNKISKCDSCELYKNSNLKEKIDGGMEPSVFAHIEFLKTDCGITNPQSRTLKKLISKARNDKLRNDVVHGRTNEVSLSILKETEQAILSIQTLFVTIQKELQKANCN